MKNTLETRLGIFFALALVAGVILLELIGSPSFFKPGFPVRARFNNIQELKPGDPVKMAGVEIGTVRKIVLAEGKVDVEMKLRKDAKVKTDSKASIKFIGLMGQNYIAVDFGSPNAPAVASDAILETVEQGDLN